MNAYSNIYTKRLWEIFNEALFAAEYNGGPQTLRGRMYIKLADSAAAIHAVQLCEELQEEKKANAD